VGLNDLIRKKVGACTRQEIVDKTSALSAVGASCVGSILSTEIYVVSHEAMTAGGPKGGELQCSGPRCDDLKCIKSYPVAYPGILFGGAGGSTNSVEDRENGDLVAVAP